MNNRTGGEKIETEPNANPKRCQENRPPDSHGGDRWAAELKWGIAANEFLDFSASINPLGPSKDSLQAIKDNLQQLEYYPEPSGLALKSALAEYLHMDKQNIVLANGSSELIYLCGRMYEGRRVIVLEPGFSEYGQGAANLHIIRINLNLGDIRLPVREIAGVLAAGDLLFIANPNNPTGNLFLREELLQVLELVNARQAKLVLDEAFMDFVGYSDASLRDISDQDNLVILGSMTKFFALPGLRIGYALSSRKNIKEMEHLLPPWRINTLAMLAGARALQDHDYIKKTLQLISYERDFIISELSKIKGLVIYPSKANFVLVDSGGLGITAAQMQAKLGPEGILIRDCRDFYNLSPYHLRLAVRSRAENLILLQKLRKVLN